jgi:hypothetical protein
MKHIGFRILLGIVMIVAIGDIAFLVFNTGVTHGSAIQAPMR